MSEKRNQSSYSRLVREVVRDSPAPLPFEEIMRRVEILRPVTTRSPTSTIRHAVTACPLIVNTGDGRFGWYPRLIGGSSVRVPLVPSHLALRRIVFAHDARELIWPGFSARDEEFGDRRPVDIQLPNDTRASLPLDFFGEGIWGTTGSGAFWDWIDACRAQSGDGLLITAIDAEARQYRIAIDAESARDTEAARHRTEEVESAARDYLRRNRHRAPAIWDLARHLLAAGHYQHAVPPEPVSYIWNRIQFFPYDQRTSLAEKAAGGRRAPGKRAQPIYQLKITLCESKPRIWRRVLVPGNTSLRRLHRIIQRSLGWTDSHLHQFIVDDRYYSDPSFELDEGTGTIRDEGEATLNLVAGEERAGFIYEYDFGDCWRHEVTVEKIRPPQEGESYPQCIAGARACPPEDCGGVWGYAHFLSAIRNPRHSEHQRMREWIGGSFDPDHFDLEAANKRVRTIR